MQFTGYQLAETPASRLLLATQATSPIWVPKTAITEAEVSRNVFGRRQPITCTIADWWWQREEAIRSSRPTSSSPKRRSKSVLKQASLF